MLRSCPPTRNGVRRTALRIAEFIQISTPNTACTYRVGALIQRSEPFDTKKTWVSRKYHNLAAEHVSSRLLRRPHDTTPGITDASIPLSFLSPKLSAPSTKQVPQRQPSCYLPTRCDRVLRMRSPSLATTWNLQIFTLPPARNASPSKPTRGVFPMLSISWCRCTITHLGRAAPVFHTLRKGREKMPRNPLHFSITQASPRATQSERVRRHSRAPLASLAQI